MLFRSFGAQCDAFYLDVVKDQKRADTLVSNFRDEIRWSIRWALIEKKLPAPDVDKIDFYWSDKDGLLRIFGPFGSAGAQVLNGDHKAKDKVAAALKKVYRYDGAFEFDDDDIPF